VSKTKRKLIRVSGALTVQVHDVELWVTEEDHAKLSGASKGLEYREVDELLRDLIIDAHGRDLLSSADAEFDGSDWDLEPKP
jgi:hypothetical protein